jgi:aspartate/tyrosine/aromatic aminotransferase
MSSHLRSGNSKFRASLSKPAHADPWTTSQVNVQLNTPDLRALWEQEVKQMYDRLQSMRWGLLHKLAKLGTPGKWAAVAEGCGMFGYALFLEEVGCDIAANSMRNIYSMCPLSEAQCRALVKDHHIYIISNGRLR